MNGDGKSTVRVLPLGGLGEIGMNMMAFACGQEAVIVDSGLMFPDATMPGVDKIIPDLEALTGMGWRFHGVVLTHGHEDHIGALPYVVEQFGLPVYATRLTMALAEPRLEEHGVLDRSVRHVVSESEPIRLGPFGVDFFAMCHSVADGVGLAITTPAGVIIHSGDFKLDPTPIDGRTCDLAKLAQYARNPVLALFSDSTNVEREEATGSEISVRPALEEIFRQSAGRILIATFSSQIHRVQQILELSEQFGRKVVLVGRSMESNARIAHEHGYLRIPRDILVDIKDMEGLADDKVTILSTGSQGEPMSALALMATDRHKYLQVKPGDVLILSSRFIPGNERAIDYIINEFFRRGADVKYEKIAKVHVSGHAGRDELRSLIRLVKPSCFVPIHGEYRHLVSHAALAVEEGIPPDRVLVAQDGDIVDISEDGIHVTDRIELRRIFIDGKGVGDVGNEVLRDRRILSEVGLITVALAVSKETGRLMGGPDVISRGVTFEDSESDLMEGVRAAVRERLSEMAPSTPEEWELAREEIRLAARRHVNRLFGRKPVVQTVVVEI